MEPKATLRSLKESLNGLEGCFIQGLIANIDLILLVRLMGNKNKKILIYIAPLDGYWYSKISMNDSKIFFCFL